MSEVTHVLQAIEQGDPSAASRLLPLVYDHLRRLAAAKMSQERSDHTLQATALVHEAWLRIASSGQATQWNGRAHFFGAAAEAMRRILVEQARHRQSAKAGGHCQRCELLDNDVIAPAPAIDPVALSDALDVLAAAAPRAVELVKLRYYAGLTLREAAETLGIAESTADADWAYAKSWLRVELADGEADAEQAG